MIDVWRRGKLSTSTEEYQAPALDLIYYANDITALNTVVLSSTSKYGYSNINYTYGNEQLSSEYGGVTETNIYDGRGSIVQTMTNSSIQKTIRYDPLGAVTSRIDNINKPFYGYNGEEYNPLTKLQYLRASI